jgi:hypothetical protein
LKLNQHLPAIKPLKSFKSEYDITSGAFGWDKIAERVDSIRAEMPCPERTFVFAHRFYTTSQLAVYLHPETVATSLHHKFNQYRFWFPAEDYVGWDALFVDDHRYFKGAKRYLPLFTEIDPEPVEIKVFRKDQLAQEMRVYRCYGFEGRFEEK